MIAGRIDPNRVGHAGKPRGNRPVRFFDLRTSKLAL